MPPSICLEKPPSGCLVNMVPKRVEIELAHSFNRWNIVWSKGFAYVKLFQKLFDNKAVKA